MMNSLFCLPGYYLVEECSPTSAGNYEWFKDLFLETEIKEAQERGISFYALAEEMAAGIGPGDQDIVFLPYIFGSNYNPQARACFVGLTGAHTRAQLIRAVLEGIVFCHLVHVEKLLANRPRPSAVRLAGGAANSKAWVRIFADVFQLPIEIVDVAELGTLGCAMAATVASGGIRRSERRGETHGENQVSRWSRMPESRQSTQKNIARYRKVSEALDGLWQGF